jgi:hypothetical protein
MCALRVATTGFTMDMKPVSSPDGDALDAQTSV